MSDQTPAVALVEPTEPGNIGTAARAMGNFGFDQLLLIDPPELDRDSEAFGFAGQARDDILPAARTITFDALVDSHHTVGFTATPNEDATRHVRFPFVTPDELETELAELSADTALVFGRERTGLMNEELEQMDQICCIPASLSYPSLNLGQAVTVTLYELRTLSGADNQLPDRSINRADEAAIERLYEQFEAYLEAINHPHEKRDKAARLLRRIMGRAHPTDREVATLTGLFRRGAAFASPPEPPEDQPE